MNLLVTGGAGFIGSHFVLRHCSGRVPHAEEKPGDTLVVLDALTYAADRKRLKPVEERMTFVEGDINDTALVQKLVKEHRIDAIVNFAAETHVDNSITDAAPFLRANVLGVQSLIEALRRAPDVLLFHISTDEVLGDLREDDRPKTVEDALNPSSPYAASKASSELLIRAAERTYGIRTVIVRCTNNFGPHQADEKFIPTVIRSALADRPVPLYGRGENLRDWLYVDDHCDALETVLALPTEERDGKLFHVSADAPKRNIDVARTILRILGKSEDLLSFVPDRPGHDWRYALDSSHLRKLGWKPRVSFEDGLRRTVEWYLREL